MGTCTAFAFMSCLCPETHRYLEAWLTSYYSSCHATLKRDDDPAIRDEECQLLVTEKDGLPRFKTLSYQRVKALHRVVAVHATRR